MSNKSVFVIDDSSFARRVNKKIFNELDYDFLGEAGEHKSAISLLSSLNEQGISPTVITLDIVMPEVTGDELLPKVLSLHPESIIIMLTSVADTDTVKICISKGAKGYIVKPVNKEKVVDALEIINVKERLRRKPNMSRP
jgi:response regulator of citrate/malate metabolism